MKHAKFMAAAAVLALAGAGCSQQPANTPVTGTSASGNAPERTMAPAPDYQLPEGFPTDFPRYGNATVFSALHEDKDDLMSLTSNDEPALILAWYGQAITHMGFDQKDTATGANGMTSVNFFKDNMKYTVNVLDQGASASPRSMISVRRDILQPEQ